MSDRNWVRVFDVVFWCCMVPCMALTIYGQIGDPIRPWLAGLTVINMLLMLLNRHQRALYADLVRLREEYDDSYDRLRAAMRERGFGEWEAMGEDRRRDD